ncbi:hypothetical protein NBO_7g0001 [Nosema bombycis CQ1]|uniref:Uncharacterized protein n=1 Tax=Nosema bombycis (strain CQ1 / CVCC 102059) TaxID=578461 RepID=R0MQL5_NOSB1|nr:hypothetical protein NBO_7g0001 [Nosema bombycis CQ1]|eukprot:EOB15183.1 hypothetical protein NBO_7g0001 [Nosema bombycis CQ1]
MIEFYVALNEYNLQGLFGGQVLDILTELRDEHIRRKSDKYKPIKVYEESFEILLRHYSRLSLLIDDDDYFNVDIRNRAVKKSGEYTLLFAKMYYSWCIFILFL